MKIKPYLFALVIAISGQYVVIPKAHAGTKAELRTVKITEGFVIEPVENWQVTGLVDGLTKYDVRCYREGEAFIAYVWVEGDGTENENVISYKRLDLPVAVTTFGERLTTFLRAREGTGGVWATERVSISEADATATVYVYFESGSDVTRKTYVVKERGETMSFKELVE